jgi:thiol:disulfide interchange protein
LPTIAADRIGFEYKRSSSSQLYSFGPMLSTRATKILLFVLLAASLAIAALAVWARKPGVTKLTAWPRPLSEARARSLLVQQCRAAAADGRLLLVEFSAPWCEHCQAVKQAVSDARVQEELDAVRPLVLNIGDGDELNALRLELGARAIPAWVVVAPHACDKTPAEWSRVEQIYPRGEPAKLAAFLAELGR